MVSYKNLYWNLRHSLKRYLNKKLNIPPLHTELYEVSTVMSTNVKDLLPYCGVSEERADEFKELMSKLEGRVKALEESKDSMSLEMFKWRINTQSAYLLYNIIRSLKPRVVVETGVAAGYSTYFILQALMRNGRGRLVSFDVHKNVGALLTDDEKKLWMLIILRGNRRNRKREFKERIGELGEIDAFIHDSEHSYDWQYFEYSTVYPHMPENSVFMSDDADFSYAFLDFCKKVGVRPAILVNSDKAFGCFIVHKGIKGI